MKNRSLTVAALRPLVFFFRPAAVEQAAQRATESADRLTLNYVSYCVLSETAIGTQPEFTTTGTRPVKSSPSRVPQEYHGAMHARNDKNAEGFARWQRLFFAVALCGLIAWFSIFGMNLRMFIGACVTIVFVDKLATGIRWFNRRTDPRHAKQPPDPP